MAAVHTMEDPVCDGPGAAVRPSQRGKKKASRVQNFLQNRFVSTFITVTVLYALFGEDIRKFFYKPADPAFWAISTLALVVFCIEIVLQSVAKPGEYFLGFYFWLDVVSTASIIPDLGYIFDLLLNDGSTAPTEGLATAKASRSGAKAARFVRVVRLVRMVRILKLYKSVEKNREGDSPPDDKVDFAIGGGSKVGKKLTEMTTRKVIMLILLLVIVLPFVDDPRVAIYTELDNTHQTLGMTSLHRLSMDWNATGEISAELLRQQLMQFQRDAGRLIYYNMSECPPEFCNQSWPIEITNQWLADTRYHNASTLKASLGEGDPFKPHGLHQSVRTGADFDGLRAEFHPNPLETPLDYIKRMYRDEEAVKIEDKGCFWPNHTKSNLPGCTTTAYFDERSRSEYAAGLNIGKTIFIMLLLVVMAYLFSTDTETYVIGPLDRMLKLVAQLSSNPLGKVKRQKYPSLQLAASTFSTTQNLKALEEDYETAMIEDTLAKIGQLLQVGFGAAGKDIIAANMQEGDLEVLLPGHKVTCVFGFGIIERFTETVGCLEAKICMYINSIAKIVHTGVATYYGGANKNMGGAFLLAWKICNGQLPGLKDPRDADDGEERKGEDEESIARQRKRIRITVSGQGRSEKAITPEEMVDSALASFIKVRVDIHNANEDGSLGEYLHHPQMRKHFGSDFRVIMGFGLHIGWAIEGAIGSRYKMDVSYLSPNVNLSARLEAATHQFMCPMLISEWLVGELSPEARRLCRLIDRVTVKGSVIPMSLYTFDIINYPRKIFEPQFDKRGRQERVRFTDMATRALQDGVDPAFFTTFSKAVQDYLAGNWMDSRAALEQCQAMREEDGPTKSLLRVMGRQQFQAPEDWRGYRALTDK